MPKESPIENPVVTVIKKNSFKEPDEFPLGHRFVEALKLQNRKSSPTEEFLTQEGPLQIYLNGQPYSVTMRTPGDDPSLSLGLLLAENVIRNREDVVHLRGDLGKKSNESDSVWVQLKPECIQKENVAQRQLISSSSCGVCGINSVNDLQMPSKSLLHTSKLSSSVVAGLTLKMEKAQSLFQKTGGCHAAALFTTHGELLTIKEDVGRHNAVDKSVGDLFKKNLLGKAGILMVSGRVSYEIVIKAYRAGLPFLIAVSAPSSLAVKMCVDLGITLVGFCRGERATIYSHPENINIEN